MVGRAVFSLPVSQNYKPERHKLALASRGDQIKTFCKGLPLLLLALLHPGLNAGMWGNPRRDDVFAVTFRGLDLGPVVTQIHLFLLIKEINQN